MSVAERLSRVRERIDRACARAGRPPGSVELVAVSKTKPLEAIREAFGAGQRTFGENYVQELSQKYDALRDLEGLALHGIGPVQRNKAREVARCAAVVESVDSVRLAEALAKHVVGRTLPVFVQVNVAAEPQKSGASVEELPALLRALEGIRELRVLGLMTIPPAEGDPRGHFKRLRELAHAHLSVNAKLSMGMSHDFEIAIEEGATHVRVGAAIFGAR